MSLKSTSSRNVDLRRRREELIMQLRKQKRIDQLNKLRQTKKTRNGDVFSKQQIETFFNSGITLVMIDAIYGSNPRTQWEAAKQFRKLLSVTNAPIDLVISTGVVPKLVEFLKCDQNPNLQFEAALSITNIACGTSVHTRLVIEAGAVPPLIGLLTSDVPMLRKQAVLALGNIAGDDSPISRDHVIDCGVLEPLLALIDPKDGGLPEKVSMTSKALWALSNLCCGKNRLSDSSKLSSCIPILSNLLHHSDPTVVRNSCCALNYLAREDQIEAITATGVCVQLVQLLQHSDTTVVSAALTAIGSLTSYEGNHSQVLISCSVLLSLLRLLKSSLAYMREDACWIVGNLTAGDQNQIQSVIASNIFPVLMKVMKEDEIDTKKEAARAISNVTTKGKLEQIKYLVELGFIAPLSELLASKDTDTIKLALNALEDILRVGETMAKMGGTVNPFAVMIEECSGFENIDWLQSHESPEIYRKAYEIIDVYFGTEEVDESDDTDDATVEPDVRDES